LEVEDGLMIWRLLVIAGTVGLREMNESFWFWRRTQILENWNFPILYNEVDRVWKSNFPI